MVDKLTPAKKSKKWAKKEFETIKKLCIEQGRASFEEGWLRGEESVFKHFIDTSIDGLDSGFKGVRHSAIIKTCNEEIERINEELNSLND